MFSTSISAAPVFKLQSLESYFPQAQTRDLLEAARGRQTQRASELLAKGADINQEGPPEHPYTRLRLLHYVLAAGDEAGLRGLLALGADPELDTRGSGPALIFALTLQRIDLLAVLLEARPYARLQPTMQELLLFRAVESGQMTAVDLLLKQGAAIDHPDRAGYTPLMRAMDAQHYELAEQLLLRGASVQVQALSGATPANGVQFHLRKYEPGSASHERVLRLQRLLERRGIVFPVPTPKELRAVGKST